MRSSREASHLVLQSSPWPPPRLDRYGRVKRGKVVIQRRSGAVGPVRWGFVIGHQSDTFMHQAYRKKSKHIDNLSTCGAPNKYLCAIHRHANQQSRAHGQSVTGNLEANNYTAPCSECQIDRPNTPYTPSTHHEICIGHACENGRGCQFHERVK